MSCCQSCESGWGDCGSGLSGLMGSLYPGSRVRTGFEFNYNLGYDPDEIESQIVPYIQNALYEYLADGVTFDNVRITVQAPGYFSKGYITAEAATRTELPDANVFGDMVAYGISQYLPRIVATRRDETLIDYVAPAARNQPGAQQAGPPQVCSWDTMDFRDYIDCTLGIGRFSQQSQRQVQQQQNQVPLQPNQCSWSRQSFGDWVACQLGITSAIGGVAAGATGALVGVGVLTLLAVVVLKR